MKRNQTILTKNEDDDIKVVETKETNTIWRNQTIMNEDNYWLPDSWWENAKNGLGYMQGNSELSSTNENKSVRLLLFLSNVNFYVNVHAK